MILRRLYIYLVSIAALVVLAFGLALLGQTLLQLAFNTGDNLFNRTSLAGYTAAVVVSLPVWAIHMWFGGRFARRDPAERASAIRATRLTTSTRPTLTSIRPVCSLMRIPAQTLTAHNSL